MRLASLQTSGFVIGKVDVGSHLLTMAITTLKMRVFWAESPGAKVIRLFTKVIYCHSMIIPSFCVIKQYYHGNIVLQQYYHGNYYGMIVFTLLKGFRTLAHGGQIKYCCSILWY
jgi:hypothetical protein